MKFKVTDPNGDVKFEKTASGVATVFDQKEVASMPGKWTVSYEWEGFTGDYFAQIVGS